MKNDQLIALAIAGIAVWMLVSSRKAKASAPSNPSSVASDSVFAKLLKNDTLPGQPGYGWKYYTDGTAISPDGSKYFSGGELVASVDQ